MISPRLTRLALACLALFLIATLSAGASRIYTTGFMDGTTNWYSDHYDTNWGGNPVGSTLLVSYSSQEDILGRITINANTGVMNMPISTLQGQTFAPGTIKLWFYSLGMNEVWVGAHNNEGRSNMCEIYNYDSPTTYITSLTNSGGWFSVDVTPYVQQHLNSGFAYSAFVFSARYSSAGSGSIAASEDSLGRGAYLEVTPEPSSIMALACGVMGLGGMFIRRRK